jgi:hypothetical protein
MRPSDIIPRLRAECPIFAGRVAGAIAYSKAAESDAFPVPHAFVLLQGITPSGDTQLSSLDQEMSLQFTVVIAVSSAADDRGQDAGEQLIDCFVELRTALLGWSSDATKYCPILMDGLTLAEGESFTRARAWAQCDFTATAMLTDIT